MSLSNQQGLRKSSSEKKGLSTAIQKILEPWYVELRNLLEACEKFEKHGRIQIPKGYTGLDIVLVINSFLLITIYAYTL